MALREELERMLRRLENEERASSDPVALLARIVEGQSARIERMHELVIQMADRQYDRALALADGRARARDAHFRRGSPLVGGAPTGATNHSTTGAAYEDSSDGADFPRHYEQVDMEEIIGTRDGLVTSPTGGFTPFDEA